MDKQTKTCGTPVFNFEPRPVELNPGTGQARSALELAAPLEPGPSGIRTKLRKKVDKRRSHMELLSGGLECHSRILIARAQVWIGSLGEV